MLKDPIMLSFIAFVSAILFLFVVLFLIGQRKTKMGEALYKIKVVFLRVLDQPIMKTNLKFTAKEKGQDSIFLEKFPIGKKIIINNEEEIVSRIVKQREAAMGSAGFCYVVYFKAFEYSEFPIEIGIKNNKDVDKLNVTENRITFFKEQQVVNELSFENCVYDNNSDSITIYQNESKLIRLDKNMMTTLEEYETLEECLCKYAQNFYVKSGLSI